MAARYSLVSKAVAFAVQALSYPLAVRALGSDRFALFALLSASLNWIALASVGIGPGLTLCLAEAVARGDEPEQRRLLTNALVPVAAVSIVLSIIMCAVIAIVPPARLLGTVSPGLEGQARVGLSLLIALTMFQVVIGVIESAQAAYQEVWRLSRATAVGNALCFVSLILVARLAPTVPMMIVGVSGATVAARMVNAWRFLAARRAVLTPRFADVTRETMSRIIRPGIAFTLVGTAAFFNNQFGLLIAAHVVSQDRVAVLAATINVILLAVGIATMLTTPLVPAIVDAATRGDLPWISRTYRRVLAITVGYSGGVGIALAFGGSLLIRRWYGLPVSESGVFFALAGAYFVVLIWEYVHYNILTGLGVIWPTTVIYVVRTLAALVLAKIAMERFGIAGLAGVLLGSIVIGPLWLYPMLLTRRLHRVNAAHVG